MISSPTFSRFLFTYSKRHFVLKRKRRDPASSSKPHEKKHEEKSDSFRTGVQPKPMNCSRWQVWTMFVLIQTRIMREENPSSNYQGLSMLFRKEASMARACRDLRMPKCLELVSTRPCKNTLEVDTRLRNLIAKRSDSAPGGLGFHPQESAMVPLEYGKTYLCRHRSETAKGIKPPCSLRESDRTGSVNMWPAEEACERGLLLRKVYCP